MERHHPHRRRRPHQPRHNASLAPASSSPSLSPPSSFSMVLTLSLSSLALLSTLPPPLSPLPPLFASAQTSSSTSATSTSFPTTTVSSAEETADDSTTSNDTCASSVVLSGCDPSLCSTACTLYGSTYLRTKCCKYTGITASLLAFEVSDLWIPRIEEYQRCTGASVRLQYLEAGEDGMGQALLDDVGKSEDDNSGQGIYDAYIVQAPWLPPVYQGLKSLSQYIKENDNYIHFMDINPASRAAVSFDGEVRALPLDADYVAMGWRQDVFTVHKAAYLEKYGEELKVPQTIEELVDVSEKLNGFDHNGDGEPDWGFCLTPQTNYFNAFLAPVLQTYLRECEVGKGGYFDCSRGSYTGQNIFFDVDNFEPLIHNEGFKYAVSLYHRFVLSSNCQYEIPNGMKCDRKTAFPTGRCAGVISMPGTLTELLREGGKYAPGPENRMEEEMYAILAGEAERRLQEDGDGSDGNDGTDDSDGVYWGRRAVFPGSKKVVDWNIPHSPLDMPLVDCETNPEKCPLSKNGINYAPFFAEGGESYALNGRQSKPNATHAMWDMFTWFAELPVGYIPLSGVYRNSQLTQEATTALGEEWNNTVMAQDLHAVLQEYFKGEKDGGNPVQDLFINGFDKYNEALDLHLHQNLILADVNEGGLFNMEDPSQSLHPVHNKQEFDERYETFVRNLHAEYDIVNSEMDGGALHQLYLWRGALDLHPMKSEQEICQDLLATDQESFDKLNCLRVVNLRDLCQSQKSDVEEYSPGACATPNDNATTVIIVLCSVVGAGLVGLAIYFAYKRYVNYMRIRKAHEQLMEATLTESIRALHQLDYPLHLVRGDEFLDEGKLMRHEVLRNSHKLTVLDSLSDVDAFISAGKHVIFFSHQWTSFTVPDPTNHQYETMVAAVRDLAKRSGWDPALKDVFVWVDYSCIPQANPSTQNLAIRSLAAYASAATYFVIAAPDTPHSDLDNVCDLSTYQKRMWCRAEQVCHSMRNGTEGMYLACGGDLVPVKGDFFRESLHVFEGDLTCCRLEHKGMGACDRQSLVVPLLGLYGELFRAAHDGLKGGNAEALSSVEAFLREIEMHQESVFPRTFQRIMWRKNKRVVEEVLLFGDLIDRMRARVKEKLGFAIDEENTGTSSTQSDNFVRHGASDFLRHGVVHGGNGAITVETAVGKLSDHMDA